MSAIPGPEQPTNSPADPLADDRALWDLLARAPRPPGAGPFFTRRTLRAVANLEEERAVPTRWRRLVELFATRPRVAWSGASFVGAAAAVVLTLGVFGPRSGGPAATVLRPSFPEVLAAGATPVDDDLTATAAGTPEGTVRESDVGVIVDLDELTDSNENRVWQDEEDESAS